MKRILVVLVMLVLLTACSFDNRKTKDDNMKRYTSLIQTTLDNDKFETESNSFNIEAKIEKKDEAYKYTVNIDKPNYALYNLEVIAVENNSAANSEKIMPAIGVFDGPFTLIPNQERPSQGFVKGVSVAGDSLEPTINLKLVVSWKSDNASKEHKEFFEYNLEYTEPVVEEPENSENVEETPTEEATE